MARKIYESENCSVSLFWGGARRGRCVLIDSSPSGQYCMVQIPIDECLKIAQILQAETEVALGDRQAGEWDE